MAGLVAWELLLIKSTLLSRFRRAFYISQLNHQIYHERLTVSAFENRLVLLWGALVGDTDWCHNEVPRYVQSKHRMRSLVLYIYRDLVIFDLGVSTEVLVRKAYYICRGVA
jgi:hypothetical protein